MAAAEDEQEETARKRRRSGDAGAPQPLPTAGTAASPAPAAACEQSLPTACAAAPPAVARKLVLVWDLDETLLIFNSLLSGSWAAANQLRGDASAVAALLELGARWEAAILRLCDEKFMFDQLEEYDQTCLSDIQPFDDGASLSGYDFSGDSFPPAGRPSPPRSPQQHAAAAHPSPYLGAFPASPEGDGSSREGAAGGAIGIQQQQQQQQQGRQQQGPGAGLDSPASRSLGADALRRLAYRFRRIALLHKFGLSALGTAEQRAEWEALFTETDEVTGGWLTHASRLLSACSALLGGSPTPACSPSAGSATTAHNLTSSSAGSGLASPAAAPAAAAAAVTPGLSPALGLPPSGQDGQQGSPAVPAGTGTTAPVEVVHVAVTSGQLIPSLAKLLLFGLSGHIQPELVWSSRHRGKLACFERVRERFGGEGATTFVAIGDGAEEDAASAVLGWPYVRVLLAPADNYPADVVLGWRPDAATGGPGLPFTQLTVHHIARAAGVGVGQPRAAVAAPAAEGAHGGSAAAAALGSPVLVPGK